MTVLLPGMTEDDQRVQISSSDNAQQGLLESWKAKVHIIHAPYSAPFLITIAHTEHGQHRGAAQQDAGVERRHPVVRAELPRSRHAGLGEELPAGARLGPGVHCDAVRPHRRGCVHDGLPVSAVRSAGVRHCAEQLRREAGLRIGCGCGCWGCVGVGVTDVLYITVVYV